MHNSHALDQILLTFVPVDTVEADPVLLDGDAQRLVASQLCPAAACQQLEAIMYTRRDLFHGKSANASRGQLDGQGNAIQAVADLRYDGGVFRCEGEITRRKPCTFREQADGFEIRQAVDSMFLRNGKRWDLM